MSDNKETHDWTAIRDDEGNIYYHNSVTDETTWDAPEKFNPPEEDADETNTSGEQPSWEKHTDDEGNVYYYNTKTEETIWDKPEGFKDDDRDEGEKEEALPSSPVGEDGEGSFLPSSPVGGGDDDNDDKEGDGDSKMEDADKGEWERHEDDEGQVYYYNTKTEETTWDKPEGFKDDDANETAKEEALPSSPVGGDNEGSFLPSSPVGGGDDDEEEDGDAKMEDADKREWERHEDDEGQVYYFNTKTEETTWDRPDGFESPAAKGADDTKEASSPSQAKGDWEKVTDDEGQVYYYNSKTEETTWDKPDGFVDEEEEKAKPEVKKEDEGTTAATPKGKSDWEKLTDDEGREYYYNATTETTQWDRPEGFQSPKGDAAKSRKAASAKKGQWEKLTDDEGREYYYNASTETTQWDKPDDYEEEFSSSPKAGVSSSKASSGQWEKFTDDDGRTYYYNATTEETQWEEPEGFVDQDEKKADEDDEFQPSPTRAPSPSEMTPEREPTPEPEPEPEPEIDPAVKRVMDAEEALGKTDSVMEPGVTAHVLEVVQSQGGNPEKAIKALIENYQGTTAICGLVAKWISELRASTKKIKDVNAIVGTAKESVADGIRNTAQEIVGLMAKERFTTAGGEEILKLSKSEAAFLGKMITSTRWRKLLIDLAAKHKGDALLMYCVRTISKQGFHRELVKRMNPSEYFTVFNAMLQSELSTVGKTAISASNDVDTSIGLEELVNDLRRSCTATAYTYLYSIEVLRHLVAIAEADEAGTHGTKRMRFRRAIRKWERISEDLDFAMVDPSTSVSTAGSSILARKRRLDVALTVSELHQRQRRRLKPSEDADVAIVSDDQQKKATETGLLNFLKRYSVGTQVDDSILDGLLPTGLDVAAASVEVGELLITYPLAIRALLSHMFKTGGTAKVSPSIKSKCARLVALAVLASEKKARLEIGEEEEGEVNAPSEVSLTRMLTEASQLCEDLALTASFIVTKSGKERGALVSPGQTLCNLALKCASVAQGVMIWAEDCFKQNDFTSSATYSTFVPSILTIVRIIAIHHPCTRLEAAEIGFAVLRHSQSGEMSYKKINEIKEQCIRLLLFMVIHGEAPAVISTLTTSLQKPGEVLKLDSSLLRYLVTGMLDVIQPPISLVFVRLFGALLKTPRIIDALLSPYFQPAYKDKLKKLLLHFHKACSPDNGATQGDVKLVGNLIRTYSVGKK